jgi:hypothetical protein
MARLDCVWPVLNQISLAITDVRGVQLCEYPIHSQSKLVSVCYGILADRADPAMALCGLCRSAARTFRVLYHCPGTQQQLLPLVGVAAHKVSVWGRGGRGRLPQ